MYKYVLFRPAETVIHVNAVAKTAIFCFSLILIFGIFEKTQWSEKGSNYHRENNIDLVTFLLDLQEINNYFK